MNYANSEPFSLMSEFDRCKVYLESSFEKRYLIFDGNRNSAFWFISRFNYKLISFDISRVYKTSASYIIVVQTLD